MPRNRNAGTISSEGDDAPELTEELLRQSDVFEGHRLVRRGRPASLARKQAISLRVDADVLERFRATGDGWQSRMNDALRKSVGL